MKLSVSFLSSCYKLKETIKLLNGSDCDYIHVDFMDGKFVPNKSFTQEDLEVLKESKKPLDVHLMVQHPQKYISFFKKFKCEYITFHVESKDDIKATIKLIHEYGIKAGLAINPDTPLFELLPYIPYVEQVLVMSVTPGAGGQSFKEEMVDRINSLQKYRDPLVINVDGGINPETIKLVNTDMAVVGSYICKEKDFYKPIKEIRKNMKK